MQRALRRISTVVYGLGIVGALSFGASQAFGLSRLSHLDVSRIVVSAPAHAARRVRGPRGRGSRSRAGVAQGREW